jgi:Brp/Blh family beta-carotene 15,15'-monooxygenase
MHSLATSLTSIVLAVAAMLGFMIKDDVVLPMLALTVAIVGVPHGALDHLTGARLFESTFPKRWMTYFLTVYLAVAVVVVWGWTVAPTATILAFFGLSAWHFGSEDAEAIATHPQHWLRNFAFGSLIIVVPAMSQSSRLSQILERLVPGSLLGSAQIAVAACQIAGLVLVPVAVLSTLRLFRRDAATATRIASFMLLFAVADPLLSFLVYFCGWHSFRGLAEIHRELHGSVARTFYSVLPLTAATVAAGAIAWWFLVTASDLPTATLRVVFIGLSSIAVPHLLLHSLDDYMRRNSTKEFSMAGLPT